MTAWSRRKTMPVPMVQKGKIFCVNKDFYEPGLTRFAYLLPIFLQQRNFSVSEPPSAPLTSASGQGSSDIALCIRPKLVGVGMEVSTVRFQQDVARQVLTAWAGAASDKRLVCRRATFLRRSLYFLSRFQRSFRSSWQGR